MTAETELSGDFYTQAFQRNLGLISQDEQARLREARIAVAGVGGVGGLELLALARMGIGKFHLADFDTFELSNFNRQVGATMDTLGRPKVDVMREMAHAINPEAEIVQFREGVQPANIQQFLEGVDVVVDGIDFFAFDSRRMLFNESRRKGLYVLTSGPIGFGSTMQNLLSGGNELRRLFRDSRRHDRLREVHRVRCRNRAGSAVPEVYGPFQGEALRRSRAGRRVLMFSQQRPRGDRGREHPLAPAPDQGRASLCPVRHAAPGLPEGLSLLGG